MKKAQKTDEDEEQKGREEEEDLVKAMEERGDAGDAEEKK